MKISYNWIKELVPDLMLSPAELAELLTMHSFETVIDREYVIDPSITVVKILKIEPHPNADRLRLATVTDGSKETRVVCGAPNIAEGQVVPYAPPGAKVYDEHGETFELTEAVIRGEKSPGMLNSIRELGVSDEHGGIVLLPEDTPLGSKLTSLLMSDTILDVDVLPDRAKDANTHGGIAKEIGALANLKVQESNQLQSTISFVHAITGIADMGSVNVSPTLPKHHPISFDPNKPSRVAGIDIPKEEVRDILQRLRFTIEEDGDTWAVIAPSDRMDISGDHDIIDEVVRMHGLDSIPPSNRTITGEGLPVSELVYWTGLVRRTLVELGFTEMVSYSFEDERFGKLVNSQMHPHVELLNPMAPELKALRYSMLPGLIGAMIKNRDDIHRSKKGQERALFEIGRVYHVGEGGVVPGLIERPVLAGIAGGDEATLQKTIDAIRELVGIEAISVKSGSKPFATVNFLEYAGEFFGITYQLNDTLLKEMKYRMPVVAFEISINALLKHAKDIKIPVKTLDEIRNEKHDPAQFVELPKYPSVFRDISLLVGNTVQIDAIESEIARVGKDMVVDVDLFDQYQPQGEKQGLAFHIEYRLPDKTLTDKEVDATHKKIEEALKKEFDAEIR